MKSVVLIPRRISRLCLAGICIACVYMLFISAIFPAFGQSQPAAPTTGDSSAPPAAQSQPPATPPANQPSSPSPSAAPSQQPAPSSPQQPEATQPAPAGSTTAKPAAPTATPPGNTETPAVVVEGKSADTLLGKPVQSASGDDMGRIIDVMVDHTGLVRAAIIDFGGFLGVGTRKIAVDWRVLHFPPDGSMDKIVADLSQDQLRVAPVYKPGEPVVIVGRADVSPPAPASPAPPAQSPAPASSAPVQPAPVQPAPTPSAPQQSAPTQNAPVQNAPARPTPTAPAQPSSAPQDNAPTQAP